MSNGDFYTSYNTAPLYAQEIQQGNFMKGSVTGSKTKILGTNDYLYTLTFYNDNGRPIQTKSKNITGGSDITTMQYDFAGKVLRTHQSHQKAGANSNTYTILNKPGYDHIGRVLELKKTIAANGVAGIEKTIVTQLAHSILLSAVSHLYYSIKDKLLFKTSTIDIISKLKSEPVF